MDNAYFNAHTGTPAAAVFLAWQQSIVTHKGYVKDFAKRYDLSDMEWVGVADHIVGFAPRMPGPVTMLREQGAVWANWLATHPLWRKVSPRRGTAYAVPRKSCKDSKALAKDWAARPSAIAAEYVTERVTGLQKYRDMLHGMKACNAGWRIREDGSVLFVIPHFATKSPNWKALDGLVRGDQDMLRDEWEAKE